MEENINNNTQAQPDKNSGDSTHQQENLREGSGFRPIEPGESKKKGKGTWMGIFVIIVLIVLIMALPSDKKNDEATETVVDESTTEELGVGEAIELADGETVKMKTVSVGGHTYSFDDVGWLFEDQGKTSSGENLMLVRLQLVDFTRDGVSIDVLPYRLGIHQGACKEIVSPENSSKLVKDGGVLTFLQCGSSESVSQIGVYQNGGLIESYLRSKTADSDFTEMNKIQTIDLATIVQ